MASTIRQIVSEAIANKLNDPRISPLTSVTRVDLSGDMQVAKVRVSVMGSDAAGRTTMAGLENAVRHVQRLVASELSVRRCPEIRFVLDESLKKAAEMTRIIDETLRRDHPDQDCPPTSERPEEPHIADGTQE